MQHNYYTLFSADDALSTLRAAIRKLDSTCISHDLRQKLRELEREVTLELDITDHDSD